MDLSQHWETLVSIIMGLAIADVLVHAQKLIHARNRVQWDALPLLWGDAVVGWGNATLQDKAHLRVEIGVVDARLARDRALCGAVDEDLARMAGFLGLEPDAVSRMRVRRL